MKKHLKVTWRWLINRLAAIPDRDRYIGIWLISFGMMTTVSAIIVAIGNPIGASFFSHVLNMSKVIIINGVLFALTTLILSALFSFIYLPLPRIFLASYSYTLFSTAIILMAAKSGTLFSYIIGVSYSTLIVLFVVLFLMLWSKRVHKTIRYAVIGVIVISLSSYFFIDNRDHNRTTIPDINDDIAVENPATYGHDHVTFLTYGSGTDLHREEFGKAVHQITPTVDASDFITSWKSNRKKFWGFDPSELPVNGRTWLPEGDGPFPIVLMVHGNHTMEYFSTSGYDYLGELLASRGMIAVSIDQDFINYSNRYGIPNDNYELRAWMMLQHIVQLQQMNDDPHHLFYEKIDFDQVGLMGHSRGGQAALMTADYTRFFTDDDLLNSMEQVNIKGVVAIAPTDKKINDDDPHLHNTSYLLLHGARDADVSDFRRDKQFYRTTFDDEDGFKASVYIADANHTQFNTDWGRMDLSFPRGPFLNQKQTMDPESQQQLTKVYMSAFFEDIFSEDKPYEALFQNHHSRETWLPDTLVVSKYRHATYKLIKQFTRHKSESIETTGMTATQVIRPKHRRGSVQSLDALRLEWEHDASYTIDLADVDLKDSEQIVLTMANIDDQANVDQTPKIQVEFKTADGLSVQLPLDDFMPFPPVISTNYTLFGLFDRTLREGRYEKSWEPVFQTFDISLKQFINEYLNLDKAKIKSMTLHFMSPNGEILVEEIGMY